MEDVEKNERADDDEEEDEEGAEHVVVLMRAANADNGAACMEASAEDDALSMQLVDLDDEIGAK